MCSILIPSYTGHHSSHVPYIYIYIHIYDACTFIIDATLQIYPLDSPSAGLYDSCTTITDANLQVPPFDSPSAGL